MPTAIEEGTHVCPPEHRHADALTCYHQHRCRCTPCIENARAKQAHRRKLKAFGRWHGSVPATLARNHIRVLSAAGIGNRRVAELARVDYAHIRDIKTGVTRHVSPDLERRIMSVPVDESSFADGQLVPALGVVRRLQSLVRMGWSCTALARELGVKRENVSRMMHEERVTVRTRNVVTAAYDRLWSVAPPERDQHERVAAAASRRRAEAAGWPPPMAWDDIDTDLAPPVADAGADDVDVVVVELAVRGHRVQLTTQERHLAVRQLHAAGHGDYLIADMLLVSDKTIGRDREVLGLPANENPTPLIRKAAA